MIEEWIRVREYLLPAIERLGGTHTETDIVAMLMAGHAKLWTADKSAVVTEIRSYPRLRELSVIVAGGDMDEILAFEDDWVAYAKDNGCSRMKIEGRKGWEKVRPDFRLLSITLIKDL